MKDHTVQDVVQYNREHSRQLVEIFKPLSENFGFTSFGYTRVKDDGSRIVLETNKKWFEFYSHANFNERNEGENSLLHNISKVINNKSLHEFYIHMLSGQPNNKQHEFLVSIDLWSCLSVYLPMNNFVEIFHIATAHSNQDVIIDFCTNKRELLQRFIHYFREKIDALDIEKAPYVFNQNFAALFAKDLIQSATHEDKERLKNYFNQTAINKFYLKTHDKFITRREAECLHYLSLGKSFKEIAQILQISPRTVESHINMLKEKTSSYSKGDLVKLSHQNYLSNFKLSLDCADNNKDKD